MDGIVPHRHIERRSHHPELGVERTFQRGGEICGNFRGKTAVPGNIVNLHQIADHAVVVTVGKRRRSLYSVDYLIGNYRRLCILCIAIKSLFDAIQS